MPKKDPDPEQAASSSDPATPDQAKKSRRMGRAELLARVFVIDMKHCPQCGSENFKPVAAIIEVSVIRKILTLLGLPDKPPDIAPARLTPQMSFT